MKRLYRADKQPIPVSPFVELCNESHVLIFRTIILIYLMSQPSGM